MRLYKVATTHTKIQTKKIRYTLYTSIFSGGTRYPLFQHLHIFFGDFFFWGWPGSLSIFSAENGDFYSLRDVNDDAQLFGFALWCAHHDFRGLQEFQSGDLEDV